MSYDCQNRPPNGPWLSTPLRLDSDGVACVRGTRVSLDTVACAFEEGVTAEEIARQYPSVPLFDAYSVLSYYLHNWDQVEEYLKAGASERQRVQAKDKARFDPTGIRDRPVR